MVVRDRPLAAEDSVHPVGQALSHRVGEVRVDIGRGGQLGVTEAVGDLQEVGARLERQRREGVSKVVEALRRQAEPLQVPVERARDVSLSRAVPLALVKTSPDSGTIVCRSRCSARAIRTVAGSRIVRRECSVFGSTKVWVPCWRA